MAYSEDEMDDQPEFVSDYYFLDEDDEPISFSVLPITWTTSETMQSMKMQIYLHGFTDDGLQKIMKPIRAWKFDISGKNPEISVLSKDNNWIKLQKPRKSYEDIVRTVLVAVYFLHLVKTNPELSRKLTWKKLSRIFSFYENKPSQEDLVDHKALIEEAVKHDVSLKKSKYLLAVLAEKPRKDSGADEDALIEKEKFIVDEDEEEDGSGEEEEGSGEEEDGSGEEEEEDDDPFDSVCCICDDGGTLLCCDGICMRSFHATREAAEEGVSKCISLGLTKKEAEVPNFKCKNCQYKQHQCFSCGQLGSSDKSSGAEVFQCVNATCGYFYHPHCVAKLLYRDNEVAARGCQDNILAGESFACPLHTCLVCNQPEDKTVPELQMAVCRRCPTAYHAKCLPKKIAFDENKVKGIHRRAWHNLLVDRILIYCLKHEILRDLKTPERNHVKFPDDEKKEKQTPLSVLRNDNASSKKKSNIKFSKQKGADTSRKSSTEKKCVLAKAIVSSGAKDLKISMEDQLNGLYIQSESAKLSKSDKRGEYKLTKTSKSVVRTLVPQLDSDTERRILGLMKDASSFITLAGIIPKTEEKISNQAYKPKMDGNKSIPQGKVERFCEAIGAAISKLDGGGSIEDAKAICEPKVLDQVAKWKSNLGGYIAPFLNGMRYTSFGRHFTKVDKLKEIVDKIHWYVNSGDTIVDFCCGANDFSDLVKVKLEEAGKNCSYRNYDIMRPKNDFSFEVRDWFTVQPHELPPGSQLIMGLNPPFGFRGALANQFIDHALKFKPKLLILIVPRETERLDEKRTPYDLVWEDFEKLSGKSFYLPGSVDVNDKQIEDWNIVPPVLYLWSRPDWTVKHKAIAEKHGHLLGRENRQQTCDPSFENRDQNIDIVRYVDNVHGSPQNDPSKEQKGRAAGRSRTSEHYHEYRSFRNEREKKHTSDTLDNIRDYYPGSRKRRYHEETHQRRDVERKRWQPSPSNPHREASHLHHSPHDTRDGRLRHQACPSNGEIEYHGIEPNERHGDPPCDRGNDRNNQDRRHRHQASPSNVEIECPGYKPKEHRRYPPPYDRGNNRNNQDGCYPNTIANHNRLENHAYSSGRRRSPVISGPQDYMREPESYRLQSEPEPRYRSSMYSMGTDLSGISNMPVTERYAPRLGHDIGPVIMARDAGVGANGYQASGPSHPGDHMCFAPYPLNTCPNNGSCKGGWLG